jgi:hypothetical protein
MADCQTRLKPRRVRSFQQTNEQNGVVIGQDKQPLFLFLFLFFFFFFSSSGERKI